ncbi:MAG TPA: hypothetical protein VJV75_00610 [Candidatus Polarisedimenticolia bacterium]|nr:hypothetical protein [Candidatus Polarisedimenticolia bacterium]
MGQRFTWGERSGRRLAGVLAAAVLIAVSAQGAIGAPSDKKPRDIRKAGAGQQAGAKQQPTTPGTDQQQPTTRMVGGVQVKVDPTTGRMQQPTAAEAQMLAASLSHMLSHEGEGLTPVQLPDGTIVIDLQDTFQEAVMASVNPKGKVTLRCVSDAAQAAKILAGQPIGDGAEISRVDAKRAALKARAAAEKE